MELSITQFVKAHADHMHRFSDSIANSGLENIGQITWRNAIEAMEADLLTNERDELIAHFREYGAWSAAELAAMPTTELNAMLAQEIASQYQERESAKERGELEEWEENFGGRLHEVGDGAWFYYLGM